MIFIESLLTTLKATNSLTKIDFGLKSSHHGQVKPFQIPNTLGNAIYYCSERAEFYLNIEMLKAL